MAMIQKFQGELWDGKMYVFDDERISVEINHVDKTVIVRDWFDGTPCERYVNCAIQSAIVSSSLRKRIKRHT